MDDAIDNETLAIKKKYCILLLSSDDIDDSYFFQGREKTVTNFNNKLS